MVWMTRRRKAWLAGLVMLIVTAGGTLVVYATTGGSPKRSGKVNRHGGDAAGQINVAPATSAAPAPLVTVKYPGSSAILTNPERGLTHVISCSEQQLSVAQLRRWRAKDHISLVWCYFYLTDFRSSDISTEALQQIRRQLSTIRAAGLKAIVRFAYTENEAGDDAAPDRVLRHIAQLKPCLRDNADVIAFVQAGFVGTWGEWAFTQHFGTPSGRLVDIDEAGWRNRRAVLDALLNALPADRSVQLRTPDSAGHSPFRLRGRVPGVRSGWCGAGRGRRRSTRRRGG